MTELADWAVPSNFFSNAIVQSLEQIMRVRFKKVHKLSFIA
jgi:hypothetical protein